jgi:hypothetical protein
MTVVGFVKQNWMLIVAGLLVIAAVFMIFQSMKKEKYYDYEMAGCSTCSAGDAGVFDNEEMYQMPDDYYSDDEDEVMDDGTADATGDDENDLNLTDDITFDDDDTYDTGGNDAEDENMYMYEETDAEDSRVLYDDNYADGYDAQGEAMAVANNILATGFDEEEAGMNADMVFAEQVMDGGMDGEEDVDMLEIDELDAEEDDYSEL